MPLTDDFLEAGHQVARLDGGTDQLWEPLWRLRTQLRPVEQKLLTTLPLRRLHFLHHGGASYIATPHTYSRLQHTLGVFALAAHFRPDDELLRLAALLHDIGHAPFSHTLEQLDDIDHHQWTVETILSPPIADILVQYGYDPQTVLAYIDGQPANLLRNPDGIVHADHLDSWVRSGQMSGLLSLPAPDLLARLRTNGTYLETDVETAELLIGLIVAEARFHTSPVNLGTGAVLAALVKQLLAAGLVTIEALSTMTDSQLEQILLESPLTSEKARRLWHQSHSLVVRQLQSEPAPSGAHVVAVDRLYLSVPLTDGQPATARSARVAALIAGAQNLLGTYAVSWVEDEVQ